MYTFDFSRNLVKKLITRGNLPQTLEKNMIKQWFRYDTGAKEFKNIPLNSDFTLAVDAVAVDDSFFKLTNREK